MNLPDFIQFEAFNDLRIRMGTSDLGYFELFDPEIHLNGEERSELERVGMLLRLERITVLADSTLAIKNSRVILYNPDESWYRNHREYPSYHLAWCSQLELINKDSPQAEFLATSKIAKEYNLVKLGNAGEVQLVSNGFVVCKHCLHTLRYRDYDEFRNRRRAYSQKVLDEFRLQDFFRQYKQYPIGFRSSRTTMELASAQSQESTEPNPGRARKSR